MLLFFNQELLQLDVRSSYNPNEFQYRCFHLALLRRTAEKVLIKTSFTITTSFITFKSRCRPSSDRYCSTHIPTSKQFIQSPQIICTLIHRQDIFGHTTSPKSPSPMASCHIPISIICKPKKFFNSQTCDY